MKTLSGVLTLSLCLITGCFSTSEVIYDRYTLIEDLNGAAINANYNLNVNVLDILNEGGVVLKTSDVTLRPATNHRWASELSAQLRALLVEALYKHNVSSKNIYTLYVYKFYGDIDGNTDIAVLFVAERGQKKIFEKTFNYAGQQEKPGYDGLVLELKKGFKQLAEQIAQSL